MARDFATLSRRPQDISLGITTLRKRSEFLRIRGGARSVCPSFVLEAKPRPAAAWPSDEPRFGFTVTKKLGSAVIRNRIRRRLRSAVSELAPHATLNCDYVLIARSAALSRSFSELLQDVKKSIDRVNRALP